MPSTETVFMLKPLLFAPLRNRRTSTLAPTTGLRAEVRPPAMVGFASETLWQRLIGWLLAPAPQEAASLLGRLTQVRADFLGTLFDIRTPAAEAARQRIETTHSLRELWHLRTEIYRLVSIAHSQFEAEQRLGTLNRHFPTRAPRSQFGPL